MPKKCQFSIFPGAQLSLEKEGVVIPCPSSGQKYSGRSSRFEKQTLKAKDLQQRKYLANANFLYKLAFVYVKVNTFLSALTEVRPTGVCNN